MDIGLIRGLVTLFVFLLFIGIAFWAYSARRKQDFDNAASLPLTEDRPVENKNASLNGEQS